MDLSPNKQFYINTLNISAIQIDIRRESGDLVTLLLAGGDKVEVKGVDNFKRLQKVFPFLDVKVAEDRTVTINNKSEFFIVK